jgi:hypothetical protein
MKKCQYCDNRLEYIKKEDYLFCDYCGVPRKLECEESYSPSKIGYPHYLIPKKTGNMISGSFIIIVLVLSLIVFTSLFEQYNTTIESESNWQEWPVWDYSDYESGYNAENSENYINLSINEKYITEMKIQLTWTDEPSQYSQGINEPDEFRLILLSPEGEELANSGFNNSGMIELIVPIDYDRTDPGEYTGTWTVKIDAGNCGDDSAFQPLLGQRTIPDSGNNWELNFNYSYHKESD